MDLQSNGCSWNKPWWEYHWTCYIGVTQTSLCTPTPLLEKLKESAPKCFPKLLPFSGPLNPIVGNPTFSPGLLSPRFQTVKSEGFFQAWHFIVDICWIPRQWILNDLMFSGLSFRQKLPLVHFLRYLPSAESFCRHLTLFELLCTHILCCSTWFPRPTTCLYAHPQPIGYHASQNGNMIWGWASQTNG